MMGMMGDTGMDPTQGALSGVRILDFSHIAAGPYGTMQLAYFGADVIKVESRLRPDGWRIRDGNSHIEASRPFADHNKNKRGMTLDLKTEAGRELALRLVATADVVVDNFSVGVMERLGLGREALWAVKPDLVIVSIPGLGSVGPHSEWVTWGPSLMPLSGLTYLWSYPNEEEPVGSQTSYPDYVVGVHVAVLILAALFARDRDPVGQWIDVAQSEVTASLVGPALTQYLGSGEDAEPEGNGHPFWFPHGCYPCAGEDRWCFIACPDDEAWAGLCTVMGFGEGAQNPEFATASGRRAHRDAVDRAIGRWTASLAVDEVVAACQAHRVPAAMVANGQDLLNDPQLAAREMLVDTKHPFLPGLMLPGPAMLLSLTPGGVWRHAPLLGQDNETILLEVLGLSTEEIAAYQEAGAFE